MTTQVRLQNLRDFTVQIRDANDQIVGTGIVVSMDGKIVTCRHIVEQATAKSISTGEEVNIYFPQLRGGEEKKRHAIVSAFFTNFDDDVILLQLKGGATPISPEQVAVLGNADNSLFHPFQAFGYRRLDLFVPDWADGIIMGSVEAPPNLKVQTEPVQLQSSRLSYGMSGSAVLDTTQNLIVGIVSETWFPDLSTKDRDTAWAVDGRVLSLEPLSLILEDMPLPLKAAPQPKFDIAQAEAAVFIKDKYSWNSAPSVLDEWTGRDDLLAQITEDWNNPQKHVSGLIGFGGEGKSSLARKWVETIIESKVEGQKSSDLQPSTFDGLFWWGFYENRSIDEFLEAALNFLSGGKIDPRQVPSSSLRAQIIGAMLGAGCYLFVLDGLEVLQYQEGDKYGLVQSNDLRDLLTYFARPDNQSFCLITSRAPVLDLMEYTTYTHRDIGRLSEADGVALLKKLGVLPSPLRRGAGSEVDLAKVVSDWDGHALTISLLGSYLADKYGGDIAHLADIPIPTADEPRYERVHRVLRRYDEHLTETEREFLKLFSAFRTPVHESTFEKVFVPLLANVGATHPSQTKTKSGKASKQKKTTDGIDGSPLREMVNRLVTYRILHCDATSQTYTAHPLVRNHYLAILTRDDLTEQHNIHDKIKDYYLSIAGDSPQYPTLDDLKPLIEVVHHACQAGAYDEAHKLRQELIDQGNRRVLGLQLGAYETMLSLMVEFFFNSDLSQNPQVSDKNAKLWILNTVGFCLMSLGRLLEAVPFYERAANSFIEEHDLENASVVFQNLAELQASLGALELSVESARQAIEFARRSESKDDEKKSLVLYAWAMHLSGDLKTATNVFAQAEKQE